LRVPKAVKAPSFSPDGKWIGYITGRTFKKVAVDGGASVTVVDNAFNAGTWASADTIIYTPNYTSGLWQVSSSGGTSRKLTEPTVSEGELGHFWPQMLPDGKHVMFTSFRTPAERSRVEVYSLESGTRTVVIDGGFYGRYVPTGHVLFARSTTVMAVRFDPDRLTTSGQTVPVIAGVAVTLPNGLAQFSVSNNGTLAYMTQAALASPRQLVWLDRSGKASPIGDARRRFEDPRISPDGRVVALTIRDENDSDIWTYDLTRGTFSRITASRRPRSFSQSGRPTAAGCSLCSKSRSFISTHRPSMEARPSRRGCSTAPMTCCRIRCLPTVSGSSITGTIRRTRGGIWGLPLKRRIAAARHHRYACHRSYAVVSPDGRWLAYRSDETGRGEIYVQAFPGGGKRVQVSLNGGGFVSWSRDGRQLFFLEEKKMMAVSVERDTFGRPSMLFEAPLIGYDRRGRRPLSRRAA
jgi:serine/threonine-protein kinase